MADSNHATGGGQADKTQTPTPELLPCPFCAGEAEAYENINGYWNVGCADNCRGTVSIGAIMRDIKANAIAIWNHRSTPPVAIKESLTVHPAAQVDFDSIELGLRMAGARSFVFEALGRLRSAESRSSKFEKLAFEFSADITRLEAEVSRLRGALHLVGSIYFYGGFKAETKNERDLEKALITLGFRYRSENEILAFGAVAPQAPASPSGSGIPKDSETCAWSGDEDGDFWETSCGQAFQFNDGGPKDNDFKFCHHCGKSVVQNNWPEDDSEEANMTPDKREYYSDGDEPKPYADDDKCRKCGGQRYFNGPGDNHLIACEWCKGTGKEWPQPEKSPGVPEPTMDNRDGEIGGQS